VQAQKSGDYAPDCLDNSALAIAPKGTATLGWSGLIYEDTAMPKSCYGPSMFETLPTCLQGKAPKAAMLELTVRLYASAMCDGSMCIEPSSPFQVTKTFDYPGTTEVQLSAD